MNELFVCVHPSLLKMAAFRGYFSYCQHNDSDWLINRGVILGGMTMFMFQFSE